MSASARIVSGQAPRRAHFGVRVRSRSTNAPPTASTHAITSTVVIDGPTWLSRKRPSTLASTRNETRPARFSDESADSIFRPSIDSGRSSPYRCRIVGATSTMLTKPSLRVVVERSSPRPNPGARTDTGVSDAPFRGRSRSHHDDRVALRVDVVEQPADELVGVAQRVVSAGARAARRTRSGRPGRPARDRTPPPARPPDRSTTRGRTRAPGRDRAGRRTARRGRLAADRGRPALPAPCPRGSSAPRPRSAGTAAPGPRGCSGRCRRRWRSRTGRCPPGRARRRAPRPRRRRARCRSRRSRR